MMISRTLGYFWNRFKPVRLVVDYRDGHGWYVAALEGYTKRIGPYHTDPKRAIQLKQIMDEIVEPEDDGDSSEYKPKV